jgi:hypothetical protein
MATSWLDPQKRWIVKREGTVPKENVLFSTIEAVEVTLDFVLTGPAETSGGTLVTSKHIQSQMNALNKGFSFSKVKAQVEKDYEAFSGIDTRISFKMGDVFKIPDPNVYKTIQKYMRTFARDHNFTFRTDRITIIVTDVGLTFNYLAQSVQPNLASKATGALGVVCDFRVFGDFFDPLLAGQTPFDLQYARGFTLVHEMGHIFGLQHPFFNQCSKEFDQQYIVDFPGDPKPFQDLPPGSFSCSESTIMASNFMDYSSGDYKMATFTREQAAFMHYLILFEKIDLFQSSLRIKLYEDGYPRPFASLIKPAVSKKSRGASFRPSIFESENTRDWRSIPIPEPPPPGPRLKMQRTCCGNIAWVPEEARATGSNPGTVDSSKYDGPVTSLFPLRGKYINNLSLNEIIVDLQPLFVDDIVASNILFTTDCVTQMQVSVTIKHTFYATLNLTSAIVSEKIVNDYYKCTVANLTSHLGNLQYESANNNALKAAKYDRPSILAVLAGTTCDCSSDPACTLFKQIQNAGLNVAIKVGNDIFANIKTITEAVSVSDTLRAMFNAFVKTETEKLQKDLLLTDQNLVDISENFFRFAAESFVTLDPLFQIMKSVLAVSAAIAASKKSKQKNLSNGTVRIVARSSVGTSVRSSARTPKREISSAAAAKILPKDEFYSDLLFDVSLADLFSAIGTLLPTKNLPVNPIILQLRAEVAAEVSQINEQEAAKTEPPNEPKVIPKDEIFIRFLAAVICDVTLPNRLFLNDFGTHFPINSNGTPPAEYKLHIAAVLAKDYFVAFYGSFPSSSFLMTQKLVEKMFLCLVETISVWLFADKDMTQMFNFVIDKQGNSVPVVLSEEQKVACKAALLSLLMDCYTPIRPQPNPTPVPPKLKILF